MKRFFALALAVAIVSVALLSPAFADTNSPPAAPAVAVDPPSRVGTVVTTAGDQKSPGYAVDIVRSHALNLSLIALDTDSRIPFTVGLSVMSKGGLSIGILKLPQPAPVPGANRFGTYGVFIETRL